MPDCCHQHRGQSGPQPKLAQPAHFPGYLVLDVVADFDAVEQCRRHECLEMMKSETETYLNRRSGRLSGIYWLVYRRSLVATR